MSWSEDVIDGATKIGELSLDDQGVLRFAAADEHGVVSEIRLHLDMDFYGSELELSNAEQREFLKRFKATACSFAQRLWETGQARLAGTIH